MNDWDPQQFEFDEAQFDGRTRLFPLPDLVLFPHVMHPLHIFEQRYREMIRDALATDRLITIIRLQPGWEADYEDQPAIASVGCLGKVVSEHRLEDGRFNILLLGLRRVEIVRELPSSGAFRVAEVRILQDDLSPDEQDTRRKLRQKLLKTFRSTLPIGEGAKEKITGLLQKHVPLGVLADLIAFTAQLEGDFKQLLLAETDVLERAEALLARLSNDSLAAGHWPKSLGGYPPPFSAN